ncbi:rab-GTPase-TBC domain-containing protein [Scheffersomyces coipomensis]|uniref:rab-GTPase-TBC domain-containing protein n=1 Tax=Scheffersomyces coipomensis TaxID=1788519 RepID=UPI00315DBE2E
MSTSADEFEDAHDGISATESKSPGAASEITLTENESQQSQFIPKPLKGPPLPDRKVIQDALKLDKLEGSILDIDNSDSKDQQDKSIQELTKIQSTFNKSSSNYLLQSKFNQLNHDFNLKDSKSKSSINSGQANIKRTFDNIKNTIGNFGGEYKIDWDFWTHIVNDYGTVINNESDKLNQLIIKGIPKEFRGIIWQLVSKSKNFELEEFYLNLKNDPSIHEKSIKRDLTRTSFYTSIDQSNKATELYNVIKAYSIFDPDVGYTQGMIFIAVPLIMNMNEAECFCLLVTLMKDYQLRNLFCPEMKGLHLLLYQFDRLLEHYSPVLYNHLVKQGIKSSMYASQWFLTFFAYKFPLDIVLRIYDIIITQGIESILKFAVNLIIKNETNLLNLKFDKLLEFLKDKLFNIYINDQFIVNDEDKSTSTTTSSTSSTTPTPTTTRRFSILSSKRNSITGISNHSGPSTGLIYYKLDDLVVDSMAINIDPIELVKYTNEFEHIYIREKSKINDIEKLQLENGNLRHKIKDLESSYANLNSDHVDIVQNMVDIKVTLPEVLNDNEELKLEIERLEQELADLKSKIKSSSTTENNDLKDGIPDNIEDHIHQLLLINAQETEKYANLQDVYDNLLDEDERLAAEIKAIPSKAWFGRWK